MAIPENDKELLAKLDSMLEHMAHAWAAAGHRFKTWPPHADDFPSQSAEYHFAAVTESLFEAYQYARTWFNENV